MTRDYLLRTCALMENKVQKLVKTNFTSKLNHEPKIKLTEQDMRNYLMSDRIDISKIIKEKVEV